MINSRVWTYSRQSLGLVDHESILCPFQHPVSHYTIDTCIGYYPQALLALCNFQVPSPLRNSRRQSRIRCESARKGPSIGLTSLIHCCMRSTWRSSLWFPRTSRPSASEVLLALRSFQNLHPSPVFLDWSSSQWNRIEHDKTLAHLVVEERLMNPNRSF